MNYSFKQILILNTRNMQNLNRQAKLLGPFNSGEQYLSENCIAFSLKLGIYTSDYLKAKMLASTTVVLRSVIKKVSFDQFISFGSLI
jgi:hypothetical protein